MALISRMLLGITIGACLVATAVAQPKIEVFTTDEFPVLQTEGMVYSLANLDEAERLTAELGKDLGNDPIEAKQKVLKQVNSPRGHELLQEIPKAFARTARAMKLGIRRLPAIVFDERWVIYGETNMMKAAASYQIYQEKQAVTK